MKLTFKNIELAPAINFLQSISELKNKDSRSRSKLVKLLAKAFEELGEEERDLMAQYDLLNEDGQLLEESERDLDKVAAFNAAQKELMQEEVVISGGMYAKNIDELPRILNELENPIPAEFAEIYDRLLDEMEKEDAE